MEPGFRLATRERHAWAAAAAILMVVSLAACSAAKPSSSPVGSPSASAGTATASPPSDATPDLGTKSAAASLTAAPTPTPTHGPTLKPAPKPTPTATPTPTDTPTPTPSPTPPLVNGPLPSVAPASAGKWTGLNWITVPGGHSPAVAPATADGDVSSTIEGWSKGYIDFVWNANKRTLTPWLSADGLSWVAGTNLNPSRWTVDFKSWDKRAGAAGHDGCWFEANNFQEGPATLLLKGDVYCDTGCTGDFYTTEIAWTSTDGTYWLPVTDPPGWWLSGGSSGFAAYDSSEAVEHLWTSADGRTWTKANLPGVPSGSWVNSPVAIAGGYVLAGVVVVKKGTEPDFPGPEDFEGHTGCPVGLDYGTTLYQAALWWSADGKTWTRDALNSVTKGYTLLDMSVTRVDDHTVIAEAEFADLDTYWISEDGKVWTHLKGAAAEAAQGSVVVGRDRGLLYSGGKVSYFSGGKVSYFDTNMKLVTLKQTGAQPWIDRWQMAMGPTGLLVTGDGTRFWLGVPTGG